MSQWCSVIYNNLLAEGFLIQDEIQLIAVSLKSNENV